MKKWRRQRIKVIKKFVSEGWICVNKSKSPPKILLFLFNTHLNKFVMVSGLGHAGPEFEKVFFMLMQQIRKAC